jgi:hypothetical protein
MAHLPPVADRSRSGRGAVADWSRSGRGTRLLDDRLGANWARGPEYDQ